MRRGEGVSAARQRRDDGWGCRMQNSPGKRTQLSTPPSVSAAPTRIRSTFPAPIRRRDGDCVTLTGQLWLQADSGGQAQRQSATQRARHGKQQGPHLRAALARVCDTNVSRIEHQRTGGDAVNADSTRTLCLGLIRIFLLSSSRFPVFTRNKWLPPPIAQDGSQTCADS